METGNNIKYNVLYIRKSRKDDESLELQTRQCLNYCKDKNYKVDRIFKETVSSNSEYREQYSNMLAYVKEHKNTRIICSSSDRLNRGLIPQMSLLEEVKRCNSIIETIASGVLCASTSEEKLTAQIVSSVHEFQYNQTKEKMSRAKELARKQGVWFGSAMFGYTTREKKLVTEPIQADYVTKIFTMISEGYTTREVSDYLTREGVKTNTGINFTPRSIRLLIKHSGYTGEHEGKQYPPIISKELYLKANNSMRSKQQEKAKSYPLSGLLVCSSCGGKMVLGNKKSQDSILISSCKSAYTTRKKKVSCKCQGSKLEPIQSMVLSDCRAWVEKKLHELYTEISEDSKLIEAHTHEMQELEEEIAKLNIRLEKLKKMYIMDLINDDELQDQSQEVKELIELRTLELQKVEGYSLTKLISNLQDKAIKLEEIKQADSIEDYVKIINHVDYYKDNKELKVNTVFKEI